jgi:hypothetical protein
MGVTHPFLVLVMISIKEKRRNKNSLGYIIINVRGN